MAQEHNLSLLPSDLDEIVSVVLKMVEPKPVPLEDRITAAFLSRPSYKHNGKDA